MTDSLGQFRLAVAAGTHVFYVRRIGYVTQVETVYVAPRVELRRTILLQPAKLRFQDVCACEPAGR